MSEWIAPLLVIVALVIIVGNISTFQKSAKTPMRKKSLNELTETLPRSKRKSPTLSSKPSKNSDHK